MRRLKKFMSPEEDRALVAVMEDDNNETQNGQGD